MRAFGKSYEQDPWPTRVRVGIERTVRRCRSSLRAAEINLRRGGSKFGRPRFVSFAPSGAAGAVSAPPRPPSADRASSPFAPSDAAIDCRLKANRFRRDLIGIR